MHSGVQTIIIHFVIIILCKPHCMHTGLLSHWQSRGCAVVPTATNLQYHTNLLEYNYSKKQFSQNLPSINKYVTARKSQYSKLLHLMMTRILLLTKGTPKSLAGLIRYEYRNSGGYKISKNTSPAITSAVEAPSWKCKSLAVNKCDKYLVRF